ncbi:integral membrane protein [Apiospora arundinis]|uniref:Integral membrane protein n=1 Tax=Apiospora arundinis TaxID=335852 RepID=A0ABR2I1I8_9PEZI
MKFPPPEVIASWPKPDYEHPRAQGPAGEIAVYALTGVVTVMLAIRMYTRIHITRGFGMDDAFIVTAYIFATGFTGISILASRTVGWGVHIYDVETYKFKTGLKIVMIAVNLFNFASCFTKLSILSTLYRLLGASRPHLKRFVAVCGGLISLNSIIFCLVVVLQCRPISSYWNVMDQPRNCLDEAAHLLSAGIINTFTDFVVVLLPIITVMKLQLTSRHRLVVIGLFSLGFLACGVGVFRTYITYHMTVDYDLTYHAGSVFWSSAVELNTGIICASVPATKPFFTKHLPQALGLSVPTPTRSYLTSFGPCSNPRTSGITNPRTSGFTNPRTSGVTTCKRQDMQASAAANVETIAENNTDDNNNSNSNENISRDGTSRHRPDLSISTFGLDLELTDESLEDEDGCPLARMSSETLPTASGPNDSTRWSWSRLSSPRAPRIADQSQMSWGGDPSSPVGRISEDCDADSVMETEDFRVARVLDYRAKAPVPSDAGSIV